MVPSDRPGERGCEYIPDLILRSERRERLEGWPRVRALRPSFETLASQAPQDEVGDIFHNLVRRDDPRRGGAQNHDRVFVGTDTVPGAGTGADAGATVTILSNFSSSGLKTNSFSCGVSMACTQTCRLTPMSPRKRWQRAEMFCATLISSRGGPLTAELIAATWCTPIMALSAARRSTPPANTSGHDDAQYFPASTSVANFLSRMSRPIVRASATEPPGEFSATVLI